MNLRVRPRVKMMMIQEYRNVNLTLIILVIIKGDDTVRMKMIWEYRIEILLVIILI